MSGWQWRFLGAVLIVSGVITFIIFWYVDVPRPLWMIPAVAAASGSVLLASSLSAVGRRIEVAVAMFLAAIMALSIAAFLIPGRRAASASLGCEQGSIPAEVSRVDYAPLLLNSFSYTIHYGKIGEWIYADLFGQITGTLPSSSHLYLFALARRQTFGVDGSEGNGLYQWLDDREIIRADGCWKVAGLPLGYPGYEGITVQYHPGAVSTSQAECLRSLIADEIEKDGHRDGLPISELKKCDVDFIGHAVVPTQR